MRKLALFFGVIFLAFNLMTLMRWCDLVSMLGVVFAAYTIWQCLFARSRG